jgi:hypothetical protein
MNRQQEIAKAREVDTRIAEQWNLYYDKASEARMVEVRAEQLRKNAARQPRFAATFEEQAARLDRSVKVLRAEAAVFSARADEIEGNEYTGWTRFFLVEHIHNSRACHTLRPTTRIGWLPSVSGLTEAEAVKEHGATLCTVCFPSAPVELTTKQSDPSVCAGSGKFVNRDLPNRMGFYTGNWATCEDCGERVTVPSNGVKLRKHKNPNF